MASVLRWTTGTRHFVAELKLKLRHLDSFSAHLDCGNLSPHQHGIVNLLVDEKRLGISTVFCAYWTSDAASQQAPLPLNSGTALVEPPLPGSSVLGVASQPGTSTIQSVIRFEMRWNGLDHFRCFFHDLWCGDVESLLHGALLNALLWDQSHTLNDLRHELRNALNRHLRLAILRNHQRLPLLRVNVLDQWEAHCFLYPLSHRHLSLQHHRDVCSV